MRIEEFCASAAAGSSHALNELVKQLLPKIETLAARICKDNSNFWIEQDDLIQEGCIALTSAVYSFRPKQGNLFWTFAQVVVQNAMTDYIRKIVSTDDSQILHLEDNVSDADSDNQKTYLDILENPFVKNPLQILIEEETHEEIAHALNAISPREREYLQYRYGFDDDQSHDRTDTAQHFHLRISRAASLEKLALDNFKLELPWWY